MLTVKCVYSGVASAQCENLAMSNIPVQKYRALHCFSESTFSRALDPPLHSLLLQQLEAKCGIRIIDRAEPFLKCCRIRTLKVEAEFTCTFNKALLHFG